MLNLETVCKNLKRIRKDKGFSQDDIARKLQSSRRNWSRYENGEAEPDLKVILAFADACGIHPAELFLNTEENITRYSYRFREEPIKLNLDKISERLGFIQVRSRKTLAQIAEETGIQEERLYDFMDRKSLPTEREWEKLVSWIDAPADWLLFGIE